MADSAAMRAAVASVNMVNPRHTSGGPAGTVCEDVLCPLCEYNLRGITEPRCPECGYAFDWADVLDPRRRLPPYVFEHHPERNVRSFLRTAVNTLHPTSFWQSLHPVQPSRRRRLVTYWVICAGLYLLALFAGIGVNAVGVLQAQQASITQLMAQVNANPQTRQQLIQQFGSVRNYLRVTGRATYIGALGEVLSKHALEYMLATAVPLAWPWVTYLSLLVFRWSMRRVRIRSIHVLRCCLYSFDAFFWVALLLLGGQLLLFVFDGPGGSPDVFINGAAILAAGAIVTGVYRLAVAYDRYLKFDRPLATVFASQVITALLVLAVLSIIAPWGVADFINQWLRFLI